MQQSNYTWLIDAGHGGIDNDGIYTTAPDKMHTFEDGRVINEGVINREIASLVLLGLNDYGISYFLLYDYVVDIGLKQRINMANSLQKRFGNCVGISIHSNASARKGAGRGFEIWTSPGPTKSDLIADIMYKNYQLELPEFPFRTDFATDKDADKEAKFMILTKTFCPFVLPENLFFDNREDAEFLWSFKGKQRIANAILDTIIECEDTKPL